MAKKKKTAAPKSNAPERKQRTREHVIADLSVNHVERLALKCGYVVQRPVPDYGIDLRLETFNDQGEFEEEHASFQLKATDAIDQFELATDEYFSLPITAKDYRLWSKAVMPIFLILYDARMEEAYWLHIQYYEARHEPEVKGDTINLRIPRSQVLGVQTFRLMRQRKNQQVELIRSVLAKETKDE